MEEINSNQYWDERFATNWDERRGIEQSQLFTRVFVRLLPDWLKKEFVEKGISVCDWGCAEGDGVVELQKFFPKNKYYGIDFSKTAIDIARKRYKDTGIKFIAIDLLSEKYDKKYDMFFASNVFEHFHEPWDAFDKISVHAKKYVAILTPYKEDLVHEKEHFHAFDLSEYQIDRGDFVLAHLDTIDTRSADFGDNPAWVGQQVLAIYARRDVFCGKKFTALDLTLAANGYSAGEAKDKYGLETKLALEKLAAKYEKMLSESKELLSDADEENKKLAIAKEKVEEELKLMLESKRWRASTKIANVVNVVRRKK